MKTGRVNTESWHYWLYDQFTSAPESRTLNICNYPWMVAKGAMFMGLFSFVIILLIQLILEPWMVGIMTLITGHFAPGFFWMTNEVFEASVVMQSIVAAYFIGKGAMWSIKKGWRTVSNKIPKRATPEPATGFLTLVGKSYRAFKDKTCMKLERYTPGDK